jgi:hypothetical protein
MKRLTMLFPLFAALACVPSEAQDSFMTANIPFNFQMGKNEMPAGKYRIEYSKGALWVRCPEQNKQAVVLTVPRLRADDRPPAKGSLEFHRYGNTYFLSRVWTPASEVGAEVVKSSHEKEVARSASQPASIALSTSH